MILEHFERFGDLASAYMEAVAGIAMPVTDLAVVRAVVSLPDINE
jgi:hypothetical protein